MRLWTVHPQYLDAKGLVALWREALLAQKVLLGRTRGYKHHPQLIRFRTTKDPAAALASYLAVVLQEASRRGYAFNARKIGRSRFVGTLSETTGQLRYEWEHLQRKLKRRDSERFRSHRNVRQPKHHPLFRLIRGKVQPWERQRE